MKNKKDLIIKIIKEYNKHTLLEQYQNQLSKTTHAVYDCALNLHIIIQYMYRKVRDDYE